MTASPSALAQRLRDSDGESVLAFLRERALKAERSAKARRESAEMWRGMTNADEREACELGGRMGGRTLTPKGKADRMRTAECDEAIALKDDVEAQTYYRAVAIVSAAAPALDRLAAVEGALRGLLVAFGFNVWAVPADSELGRALASARRALEGDK